MPQGVLCAAKVEKGETMLKAINILGVLALFLLLRKLIWCLRWLWCWKHDWETPPPIGWLPNRDGGRFDAHVQKRDGED